MMKLKKSILASIIIGVLGCIFAFALFLTPQRKPSIYSNRTQTEQITVKVEKNHLYPEIIYLLTNPTSSSYYIKPYVILEYYDGQNWNEVLTRTRKSASELGYDAIATCIPAHDIVLGTLHFNTLSTLEDGRYRLLFPSDNGEEVIISQPFDLINL